ncbi:MAG TPA: serine hydrolase domain-containing protein [Candidatus Cloacimonadota bacterium]|nr:serine hydrolase domain-containing protein [Candidatus Cloacimonadota bacterium]
MKPYQLFLSLLLFCLIMTGCTQKTTETGVTLPEIQSRVTTCIDSIWGEYVAENNLSYGGLAISAFTSQGLLFAKSGLTQDVNIHSFFRGASNTKTYTASSIMLLQQRGLLNINDCITDTIPGKSDSYIPNNSDYNIPYKNQITIRQLLEHRAGVFDLTNFPIPDTCNAVYAGQNYLMFMESFFPAYTFSMDELFRVISRHQLCDFSPDSGFQYTNTGYSLLGIIIERVSGQSYQDFVSKNLLIPNSLLYTTFPLSTNSMLSEPYISGKILYNQTLIDCRKQNFSYEFAQGNLVTTSLDLLTWLKTWQKGQAGLPLSTVQQMRQGSGANSDYGFGTTYVNGMGYGHTGAIAGYLSFMFYSPEEDFTMLLVCNLWNMNTEESFYEQIGVLSDIFVKCKEICTGKPIRQKPDVEQLYKRLVFEAGKKPLIKAER